MQQPQAARYHSQAHPNLASATGTILTHFYCQQKSAILTQKHVISTYVRISVINPYLMPLKMMMIND
jgi:hypothetical protein